MEEFVICSFCEREQSEGDPPMIAGPRYVYICDDCVEQCVRIIKAHRRG